MKKCIACHRPVPLLFPAPATNLDGGVDGIVVGSYGSVYDCTAVRVVVCDTCIGEAIFNGIAEEVSK